MGSSPEDDEDAGDDVEASIKGPFVLALENERNVGDVRHDSLGDLDVLLPLVEVVSARDQVPLDSLLSRARRRQSVS